MNSALGMLGNRHVAEHMSRSQIRKTRVSVSLGETLEPEGKSPTELPGPSLPLPPPKNKQNNASPAKGKRKKKKNEGDEVCP